MMEFLQIAIGEIKRKKKKKKIASYGSRFDEEISKIGRFQGLGMEERRKGEGAAQGFLKNVIFIDQDALLSITSNGNRLQVEAAYW